MNLKILGVKEAPFVLLGLVAILSWSVKHVVDRATKTPIIEYSIKTLQNEEIDLITCGTTPVVEKKDWKTLKIASITNLSNSVAFKDSVFALRFSEEQSDAKFLGVRIQAKPPAIGGKDPGQCGSSFAKYSNITLYPGWELRLISAVNKESNPILHMISSDQIVLLKEKGLVTFLIRNETTILLVIISILILVLGAYIWHFSLYVDLENKREKKDDS